MELSVWRAGTIAVEYGADCNRPH